MTEERCYRLAHQRESVEVRGDAARDALIAHGYSLVSAIDCLTGSITAQADPEYVTQGEREWAAFEALPEDEKRALRRKVGGVQVEMAGQSIPWGGKEK
jgi:hypothetical protein